MKPERGPDPERLFSIFLDLVGIDSESGSEGEVARYVKEFCSRLGLQALEDGAGAATGGQCGNILVDIPGGGDKPLILNAHMDTVVPGCGVAAFDDGSGFSSTGETVLGADCKAGLAAILAAVEALLGSGTSHRALELVFTVQEETGLVGASHFDVSTLRGEWGVVLDGSGPVGGIVIEAPGQDQVEIVVRGRSAHAGVEPEKGVSAIACASEAVAGLRLGRRDDITTSNIGLISGGKAVNIVPDLVSLSGEVRSLSDERLDQEREAMLDSFTKAAASHGCELDVKVERKFEHFRLDENAPPVRCLQRAMSECGIESHLASSGGGSDANVFNGAGLELAVMHIGLVDAHTPDEFIRKEDLLAVSRVVHTLAAISVEEEGEGPS